MPIDLRSRKTAIELFADAELVGKELVVAGWAEHIRVIGRLVFIVLRDRTGRIQLVVRKNVSEDSWKLAKKLGVESAIAARGVLKENDEAPGGRELVVQELVILSDAEPLPIDIREPEKTILAKRLDYRYLDLRNDKIRLIFKIQADIADIFRRTLKEKGFTEIFTPKILGAASEGGAEVFTVIYFKREAFLAQSPQLYKQLGVISGLERVFEVGPVFRAEPHHTPRHLTEYTSMDYEMGFISDFNQVMDVAEAFLKNATTEIINKYGDLLEKYYPDALLEPVKEIPRMPLEEVQEILKREYGKEYPPGEDLDTEGERLLGEFLEKEYGYHAVFITKYPWGPRPFYTMPCTCVENHSVECCEGLKPETPTCSFDLIFRGLEMTTGGQRQHDYKCLLKQVENKGINPETLSWYIEMFKYGAPPHGGAGTGLERVVKQILGLKNIREARLLPRDPERLTP
ncbi:MAG: aspartate--tRNA(Asn) ligase [Desulfurococcales archaeon]|nr:aspartate--tRNA(Asn) ligase [Desulfurococcales archaeon]